MGAEEVMVVEGVAAGRPCGGGLAGRKGGLQRVYDSGKTWRAEEKSPARALVNFYMAATGCRATWVGRWDRV